MICGYIIFWLVADEVHIQNIVVAEPYRRRGLGRLLLHFAIAQGMNQEFEQALLEVRESNVGAIALYHQYQFVIVGTRENYYRNGETALLMSLGPFESDDALEKYREFMSKQASRIGDQLQFRVE